jgi:hypothetical protein
MTYPFKTDGTKKAPAQCKELNFQSKDTTINHRTTKRQRINRYSPHLEKCKYEFVANSIRGGYNG